MATFEDVIGTNHFTIGSSGDWTLHSAVMPNGDNAVAADGSVVLTRTPLGSGSTFDIRDGTDWTIEFWLYFSASPGASVTLLQGGHTSPSNAFRWAVNLDTSRRVTAVVYNTVVAHWLQAGPGTGIATSTWVLVHVVRVGGSPGSLTVYVDNVSDSSDNTGTGTVVGAPDGNDFLSFGSNIVATASSPSSVRVSKLAIYDVALDSGQRAAAYTEMTAP